MTAFVAVIALLICFAIVVQASIYKTQFADKIPNLAVCESDVPQTYGYGFNITRSRDLSKYSLTRPPALDRGYYDNLCNAIVPGTFYVVLAQSPDDFTSTMVPYNFSSCIESSSKPGTGLCPHVRNQANKAHCPCVSLTSSELCSSSGCEFKGTKPCHQFEASTIGSCYCFDSLTKMIKEQGVSQTVDYIKSSKSDACYPFFENYSTAQGLTYSTTIVTILVNIILKYILINLTKFEKHSQLDEQQSSHMLKVFLSTYINISLVVLIAFGKINGMPSGVKAAQIFQGNYPDFTREWYGTVGAYLVLTLAIQILTLPVSDLMYYSIINPLKRNLFYVHIRQVDISFGCIDNM